MLRANDRPVANGTRAATSCATNANPTANTTTHTNPYPVLAPATVAVANVPGPKNAAATNNPGPGRYAIQTWHAAPQRQTLGSSAPRL